ncbi:hypothetical protein CDL12_29159 [Handroanthus impetiginosus]|uniref:Leucine-rich repeat protein n=1 Tax=Handroanthus impetiginosus TaxID=429701 RepID=A0A2G9FZ70_9LAMI|nr:hypothetical protein CDL12_29159 [Handroanthus impetiginosus]
MFFSILNNNLTGEIPPSICSATALQVLDLSANALTGELNKNVPKPSKNGRIFKSSTYLPTLDLSHNNLSLHVNEKVPISSLFPRLGSRMLASCKLQKLPLFKAQSSLMMLDLAENQLEGEIPNWIWEVGNGFLRFCNLSNNQFTRLQEPYDSRSLHFLDVHSNLLSGQIPLPPPSAVFIDLNNNFSSSLPENIGDFLRPARFFSVATNGIIGTIPFSNNLSGDIPSTFPVGCALETLALGLNVLQGKVPRSLERCTEIEIINLSNNDLNDCFPCWLKNLSKIRVLVLSFNKFRGNISCLRQNSSNWPNLQIINIASKNFHGVLPATFFQKLKALMVDENGPQPHLDHLHLYLAETNIYYQDSITVTIKGLDMDLRKILTIFTSIDFSNNHFQGIIPETIGEMKSLCILNFSRNALSDHIPSSIGSPQKLESLDLSFNNLNGQMPQQIARPTFFSFLNLSYNHLVGRIPQGSQMQTFTESSYIGNDGLCGFPLNKTCNGSEAPAAMFPRRYLESEEKETSMDSEIYVSAALGFLVGLGVILAPLLFC